MIQMEAYHPSHYEICVKKYYLYLSLTLHILFQSLNNDVWLRQISNASIHKVTNRSPDSSDFRFCLLHHLHCRHSNPLMWPSRVYGPAAAGDLCHGPWSVTISDLIQFTYLQIDLWWCYEVPGFCGHKLSSVYWKWTAGLSHSHLIT